MKLKPFFQNFGLALASIGFTLIVLEFFVFPYALPLTPLKLHFAIKEPVRILAQSSKQSAVPDDYIALFGDSYSQGYGDWLLDADPNSNPPYHSAHVLHDITGKEIITFGKSGSGSLSGLVGNPIRWLDYIQRSRISTLGDPKEILIYFYEGNDLNDNMEDLKLRFIDRKYDPSKVYDESYFNDFIEKEVIGNSPYEPSNWTDIFLFTDFMRKVAASLDKKKSTVIAPEDMSPGPGEVNRVRIAGKEMSIPDGLQSPALELSPGEIHLAMYLFKQSLDRLKKRFPEVPVTLVYLPSVLTCYDIASPYVSIQVYDKSREPLYPAKNVHLRSEKISSMIRKIVTEHNIPFFDARPVLRRLARKQVIHGPKDWKHYNKDGYTALAKAIVHFQQEDGNLLPPE